MHCTHVHGTRVGLEEAEAAFQAYFRMWSAGELAHPQSRTFFCVLRVVVCSVRVVPVWSARFSIGARVGPLGADLHLRVAPC